MPGPVAPHPVHAVAPIQTAPSVRASAAAPLLGQAPVPVATSPKTTVRAQPINSTPAPEEAAFNTSDKLALISLVVSGLTFVFTLSAGYQNKRIEIKARKFDKLCLEPIEAGFKGLDNIFANAKGDLASVHHEAVAEGLTEINYLLIQLKSIYPRLDFDGIERRCDKFSELFFDCEPTERVADYFAKYFYTKTQVLNSLFHYAIEDHIFIRLMPPIGKWWRDYRDGRQKKQVAAATGVTPTSSPPKAEV